MKIEDILAIEKPGDQVAQLKLRATSLPVKADIEKDYDISSHTIKDTVLRPNKAIYETNDSGVRELVRYEIPARIAIPVQKLIVNRAVAFLFGNPVRISAQTTTDPEKTVLSAIKEILKDAKIDTFNRKVARDIFRGTEAAEYWFPVPVGEGDDDMYGIGSRFKLRCAVFSPMRGDDLYPLFDETGDLIAFSREYSRTELGKVTTYFETYTAKEKREYVRNEHGSYADPTVTPNVINKIPIVYGVQNQTEWADVQDLIDRIEKIYSNFADTNDYHGSPTIVVKGNVKGFAKKGEQGKIIEVDNNSDASYMSWPHAPESVKLEIENLWNTIYCMTQTPDISFDQVKGLGQLSGVALKLLFIDAHLKVKAKQEIFDDYIQRRLSILKAYTGALSTKYKAVAQRMVIDHEIIPYMVDDIASLVDMLTTANAGKPVVSTKTAVALAGLSHDSDAEYAEIVREINEDKVMDIGEPTI